MPAAPTFDPSQPYESIGFDPSKPFEPVGEEISAPKEIGGKPVATIEGRTLEPPAALTESEIGGPRDINTVIGADVPLINPEAVRAGIEIGTAGMGQAPIVQGAREELTGQLAGLTTPKSLAIAPAFTIPIVGQGLALSLGTKAAAEGAGRTVAAIESGNAKEIGGGLVQTAGGLTMAIPGAKILERPTIPPELIRSGEEAGLTKSVNALTELEKPPLIQPAPKSQIPINLEALENGLIFRLKQSGEVPSGEFTQERIRKIFDVSSDYPINALVDVGIIKELPNGNFEFNERVKSAGTLKNVSPVQERKNASTVRSDTGQLPQAGQAVEGGEKVGGNDIQQPSSGTPIAPEPRATEVPQAFQNVKSTEDAWSLGADNQTPQGIAALEQIHSDLNQQMADIKSSDLPPNEKLNQRANLASGPLHFIKEAISAAKGEADRPAMTQFLENRNKPIGQANKVAAMTPEQFSAMAQQSEGGLSAVSEKLGDAVTTPEEITHLKKLQGDAEKEFNDVLAKADEGDQNALKNIPALASKWQFFSEAIESAVGVYKNKPQLSAETIKSAIDAGKPALGKQVEPTPIPGSPADKFGAIYGPKLTPEQITRFKDLLGEQFELLSAPGTTTTLKVKPSMLWIEINRRLPGFVNEYETGVAYLKIRADGTTVLDASKHGRPIDQQAAEALIKFLQETGSPKSAKTPQAGQLPMEPPIEPALGQVGMGGAKPAELPARPGIEETIPARSTGEKPPVIGETPRTDSTAGWIENIRSIFNPENRGKLAEQSKGFLGTISGQTMPRTTIANQAAGEAGARYLSSRIFAPYAARLFSRDVMAGLNIDPVKFGAALSEDNLRSVRAANPEAGGTFSFVGEGKPFKTEAEYQAYLKEPNVQEAIKRHISNWNAVIEPMYREAQRIDPDVELPSRGEQTGARVNLAAVLEGEAIPGTPSGSPRGGLLNTLRRKSPFGREAKGTGEAYHANYDDLIANSMYRQMEIANKNVFDQALVDKGLAVIAKPGQQIEIGGKPAVPFPLKRKVIITEGGGIPQAENIYVRRDLATEYRNAANVDENPYRNFVITKLNSAANQAALAGLTDATVHVTNLSTSLAQLPVSKLNLISDSLLSAAGRLDIPIAGMRVVKKGAPEVGRALLQRSKLLQKITPDVLQKAIEDAFWKNQTQLAGLAEIGATKAAHPSAGLPVMRQMSDVIQWYDRTTRMVLDDAYKDLAERGIVENSETARREFVNQVGQYNKRAQGVLVRLSRDLGTGPFVTAGRAFNVLGVRGATLSPGVKATSAGNAALLRANAASKWLGTFAFVGLVNYLITGHVQGRKGTPIGSIDTGTNDEQGRMKSFSIVNLTGQGRALRVTGLRGAIEAKQKGLPSTVAADAAARDIANSWIAPFAGPPVKAAFTAVSGFPPAISVGRSSKVVPPGQSQTLENVTQAGIELNPIVAGTMKSFEPGKTWEEAVKTQLPRFTMQTKQPEKMIANYPAIVRRAQANAYIEDVIHRARYIENAAERKQYVRDSLKQLDPQDREHAMLTLRFRKIDF